MRNKDDFVVRYKDISIHKIINSITYKKCRQCGEFKPMSPPYFYKGKKGISDGYSAICQDCVKNPENRIPKGKEFNEYEIRGDITAIFLERRDGAIIETLIDTEDLERLKSSKLSYVAAWDSKSCFYYAKCSNYLGVDENGKTLHKVYYLHREVMQAPEGYVVDHIDENNPLDNRKINLRVTNQKVNTRNRNHANKNSNTGVKNVNWIERTQEYWVQICKNYIRYKWTFPANQFKEACDFAEKMRIKLHGTKETMVEVDAKS